MKVTALLFTSLLGIAFATETPAFTSAPQGLRAGDWAGIRLAYEAGSHAVHPEGCGVFSALNPGQQWKTVFDGKGFTITPESGSWTWGLELSGYDDKTLSQAAVSVTDQNGKIACQRDQFLTEWFINDSRGLEQGWSFQRRPERTIQSGPLRLHLSTRGDLHPRISADGMVVYFHEKNGRSALTYGGLKAWDADGKTLPARFEETGENSIHIAIDEQNARYPITIDPIAQQSYLKASNTEADDYFGWSVAISGDTVVIGAWGEDSNAVGVNGIQSNNSAPGSGAVYVFIRSGGIWSQQAYLKASNPEIDDYFGWSVAISGDTIVVGAPREKSNARGVNGNQADNSRTSAGAAYVFTRSAGVWSQQAYLKASNTDPLDQFGYSVAISGDTAVVGARGESSTATGVNGNQAINATPFSSGAAYVFVRNDGAWSQQAYLKASNTEGGDYFGSSVAISGDTVAVGAWLEDSNATGVGGNQTNNNSSGSGAAYVFIRSGATWSQQAYLKASNTGADDNFGYTVAVSGDNVIVGAVTEDSSATGINGNQTDNSAIDSGAAYVFTRGGGIWSQQAYLKASNTGAGDLFGGCVAISGDVAVIGASKEASNSIGVNGGQVDNSSVDSGAGYIFTRNNNNWSQQTYVKASNTGTGDRFGFFVAISGDTAVVGASYEDSGAVGVDGNQEDNSASIAGAAYVFNGAGVSAAPGIVIRSAVKEGMTFKIDFASESGLTGWRIKGSGALESFTNDLTAATIFTEVSPGWYQAVIDLTGLPEDRYFLRIER